MTVRILKGDCREVLKGLPENSVHCCVTSPPYWGLRDYGMGGQIGLEPTPAEFAAEMVAVFDEVRRVLRDDGTLWLNLGDSYMGGGRGGGAENCKQRTNVGSLDAAPNQRVAGYKQKDLVGIPWEVAFALRKAGWWLRQDIIWSKPNPMPESVTDRCTKAHEYLFLMTKSGQYHYDADAISEAAEYTALTGQDASGFNGKHGQRAARGKALTSPRNDGNPWNENNGRGFVPTSDTRNKRSVWSIPTSPFGEAHFATFPPALIEPCILAGCSKGGTVLDPFGGAGTTGMVADRLGRNAILIELNPEYAAIAEHRIKNDAGMFAAVE
jgi:DNA modification methylase